MTTQAKTLRVIRPSCVQCEAAFVADEPVFIEWANFGVGLHPIRSFVVSLTKALNDLQAVSRCRALRGIPSARPSAGWRRWVASRLQVWSAPP